MEKMLTRLECVRTLFLLAKLARARNDDVAADTYIEWIHTFMAHVFMAHVWEGRHRPM